MNRHATILATLAAVISILTLASVASSQEPIRVHSNEVLVPVFVEDKKRVRDQMRHPDKLGRAILAGDMQLANKIEEEPVIRGLTAADFQVFEDGKQRTIRNVSYEASLYWDVRDNIGHHTEYLGPGGGKWSTVEWPPNFIGDIAPPHYLLAYALPESSDTTCHQIKVIVDRPNALIAARSEYCNTKRSSSDPLNGTKLGEQLEDDLATPKDNSVDTSIAATALYSNSDTARVHIALDWPGKSLRGKTRTKGLLGVVLTKNGSIVTRFSDIADRYEVPDREIWHPHRGDIPESNLVENHYDTQVELPPGVYDLRVALGDGTRFGRSEIPLTVDSYDRKTISITPVSLCKQISDVSANARNLPGAWNAKLLGSYVPLVSNETEFRPTSDRRFNAGENLYVYFEVYEALREGGPQPIVDFQIRIVDLKSGTHISDSEPVSASHYSKVGSSIIPIGRGIDISKLPKGSYRLDVRATDSTGESTDWRSVNFTIE